MYLNAISGSIPTELGLATNLRDLALDVNQLSGPLPSQLGSLTGLQTLWLNDNYFTGTLPSELGDLTLLSELSLQNNWFNGIVPSSLSNLNNWGKRTMTSSKRDGAFENCCHSPSYLSLLTPRPPLPPSLRANRIDVFGEQQLFVSRLGSYLLSAYYTEHRFVVGLHRGSHL